MYKQETIYTAIAILRTFMLFLSIISDNMLRISNKVIIEQMLLKF